jgi:transcription antitermination factor NusA-like protein
VKMDLCSFCLKSGILCQKCSAKVKAGDITELDLRIARQLLDLEEKYPSLQNVYFHRAVEVGRTLAIIVGHGDVPRLLGYGGKIIKALGEETGKSIRILESGVDDRKFLEDLFSPMSILTINTIWLPDGTTETRVILRRKRGSSMSFDSKGLAEIARKVRKMSLRVEFAD